ncbi:MAG: hypothetical protein Q4F81_11635 [Eubacteriales bacterium]|nr:hypothetical protein [Eubacteriales bacterium]
MSTIVPMYGFGGGGGTGATLTVTAPAGVTVTVSKDGKTKTKVAGSDGIVVFKGLKSGEWTLTITDGEQTAQKTVTITADYTTAITFFSAIIHVTYPAGSTCTATDSVTTLTAPDTSGVWECVVPNSGTWTIIDATGVFDSVAVDITTSGQSVSASLGKKYIFKAGEGFKVLSSTATQKNATVTYTNESIVWSYSGSSSSGYQAAFLSTDSTINLKNFSKVYVNANVTSLCPQSANNGRIEVSTANIAEASSSSSITSYAYFTADSTTKNYALDISSLTESYYVGIYGGLKATIYDIWLEV